MAMITKKTGFAVRGLRIMRNNPDGTVPSAARFVGFVNTADLSSVLTAHKADINVKIDDNAIITKSINFTAVVSEAAVTVAEAVTALTTAAVAGVVWSKEAGTGRLMGVAAGGKVVQVTGALAAALGFGQCDKFGGNGLEYIKLFDDRAKGFTLPKNVKEKEEIDNEGANGTIDRMVISAKLLGMSPVLTLKDKDYDLLEVIQGGKYDRIANTYDPPNSSQDDSPTFNVEFFRNIYGKGTVKTSDLSGVERILLRSCIGLEGDVSAEAKAWAAYSFNIEATETADKDGNKLSAWQEGTLTIAEYDALNPEAV